MLSWRTSAVLAATTAALVPAASADASVESKTIRAVNAERAQRSLPRLIGDRKLARAADGHTGAMLSTRTFAHQVPGEPALGGRVRAQGFGSGRWKVGEVLAWGLICPRTTRSRPGFRAPGTARSSSPAATARRAWVSPSVPQRVLAGTDVHDGAGHPVAAGRIRASSRWLPLQEPSSSEYRSPW